MSFLALSEVTKCFRRHLFSVTGCPLLIFFIFSFFFFLIFFIAPRGASHQPIFIGSCLTISHMCLSFLPIEELVLVFYDPLWLGLCIMVVLSMFYFHGEYGYSSVGSYCHSREWLWNTKAKICCMASRKFYLLLILYFKVVGFK